MIYNYNLFDKILIIGSIYEDLIIFMMLSQSIGLNSNS